MVFNFRVAGIPCLVDVTLYHPGAPMRITGSGFGDCDPPEPVEFEFRLRDRKGYSAAWLERKLTPAIEQEIYETFLKLMHEKDP